jgi:hypothetical protein
MKVHIKHTFYKSEGGNYHFFLLATSFGKNQFALYLLGIYICLTFKPQ